MPALGAGGREFESLIRDQFNMVGSTGVRRRLINSGDWSDGLERKGSNPLPTTKQSRDRVTVIHESHKLEILVRFRVPQPRCTVSLYAVAGWPLYTSYEASQTATRVLLARLDIAHIWFHSISVSIEHCHCSGTGSTPVGTANCRGISANGNTWALQA